MPASTEGMPSSSSTHCQPAQPFTPCMLFMMVPASGPPITPAKAEADMNMPKALARRLSGNQ
ncbi:hypothetical protein D9M69_520130 [compost metagenome]